MDPRPFISSYFPDANTVLNSLATKYIFRSQLVKKILTDKWRVGNDTIRRQDLPGASTAAVPQQSHQCFPVDDLLFPQEFANLGF